MNYASGILKWVPVFLKIRIFEALILYLYYVMVSMLLINKFCLFGGLNDPHLVLG